MSKANVAISLFLSLAVCASALYIYDKYFAQKIVTFDLKGYIAKQGKLYAEGEIDDEQLKARIKEAASLIENLPQNRVVLTSDVVLRGAEIVSP